jgi:hemoglobin
MDLALEQVGASEELIEMLKIPLFRIAEAVRNKEGPGAAKTDPNVIASG